MLSKIVSFVTLYDIFHLDDLTDRFNMTCVILKFCNSGEKIVDCLIGKRHNFQIIEKMICNDMSPSLHFKLI